MSHFDSGNRFSVCEGRDKQTLEATHRLARSMKDTVGAWTGNDTERDFEAVFLCHFSRVVGVLTRLVGDRNRAEELANEVFWKLYKSEQALIVSGNVAPWLYRTATHAGIDAIRASKRRSRYEQAAALAGQGGEVREGSQLEDLLRNEQRATVQSVLTSMKPAQAQIVLMRASGASYRELAEALGVAVSGVGTLLNRAEAEFRRRYLKRSEGKKEL